MHHSSSSRETIVDDEGENMSPTQCEENREPKRDDFIPHEEGTCKKSEFNHPQIPIAQNMIDQSKMRQKRNQACKAINVAKCVIQKEKQKWLKG
ncbi:hypothetical protein O181_017135 [Austropuccinia psidii MF-1]|uniref:Uncharacterized protein n=1 Tax=Austropuccinia psidii MF-1 TaxID=1389203 RepID=A0A9Q3C780_9BASI|nr:hypothetical protein [Austropuccinia psidii MF-1]